MTAVTAPIAHRIFGSGKSGPNRAICSGGVAQVSQRISSLLKKPAKPGTPMIAR